MDAETGRLLWEAHVTGVTNHASDGVIYEDGPGVTALDMTTGKALWRQMHSSVEVLGVLGLEVWPESHWPGFALRQADVSQFLQ